MHFKTSPIWKRSTPTRRHIPYAKIVAPACEGKKGLQDLSEIAYKLLQACSSIISEILDGNATLISTFWFYFSVFVWIFTFSVLLWRRCDGTLEHIISANCSTPPQRPCSAKHGCLTHRRRAPTFALVPLQPRGPGRDAPLLYLTIGRGPKSPPHTSVTG